MKITLGELRDVIRGSIDESMDEAGFGRKLAAGFALGAALGGTAGYQAGKQPVAGKMDHYAQEMRGQNAIDIVRMIDDADEETADAWLSAMIDPSDFPRSKELNALADEVTVGSPHKVLLHMLNRDPKLFMKYWKRARNK